MTRRPVISWGALAVCLSLTLGTPVKADPRAAAPDARVATVAQSAPAIVLLSGEHPGFSRIVVELPGSARAEPAAQADGLAIRVPGAALVYRGAPPRNLRTLQVTGDTAVLTWAHTATIHMWRMPGRLVVDVRRPTASPATAPLLPPAEQVLVPRAQRPEPVHPTASPATPAATFPKDPPGLGPEPRRPEPRRPDPEAASSGLAKRRVTDRAALAAAAPEGAAPPVAREAAAAGGAVPAAAAMSAGPSNAGPGGPASVALAFSPSTGAAAFRRSGWGIAVFDEARPIDLASLRGDAAFAQAQTLNLPAATVLLVPLASRQALALRQEPRGWSVAVVAGAPPSSAIRPLPKSGGLELPVDHPGRVVALPDPDTGGLLLVGTQASARTAEDGPPQAMAVRRQTPSFTLVATWRGVVVEPQADDLVLRSTPSAFLLERQAAAGGVSLVDAIVPAPPAGAEQYERRFDLPSMPLAALRQRFQVATALAASRPDQDRGEARLRAAEAMLALGMGPEAEALVRLAWNDDPRLQGDPQAVAVHAAAALLAGRTGDATAIDDPVLSDPGQPGLDEVQLWRALRAAQDADSTEGRDPAAAQILAAKLPLLQSYPDPLRTRLLPLALRTMVLGGETAAARHALDAMPEDRTLDLARALLEQQAGHVPEALRRLDSLAEGRDRDTSTRAAIQAIELRRRSRMLTDAQAANALDPLVYAWRGDRRELSVRLREAALRMQCGQVRAAMALLREALDPALSQGWADQVQAVRERFAKAFAEILARDATQPLPPLEFLAVVQDNGDLLPDGPGGLELAGRVADRLAALDLPDQAAAALGRLMSHAQSPAARATLGARLAALQLEQRDPSASLRTLSASTAEGLAAPLVEGRTLLFARATAARGNLPAATGALAALGTPAADDLRAQLLERAGRWPEATAALQLVAGRVLAAGGRLDDAQTALVLRLASAAAQAGDPQVLASLRAHELSRVPAGKSADLLRILTEGPVQTVADLPRAQAEIALARTVLK